MKRRAFITLLGGAAATWPRPISAQQKITAVVGFLGTASDVHLTSAFEMRLRELGWIEGQNLVIEYRWAGGDLARFPALVDELVWLRPDLMVAGNNQAAIAMRKATAVIPIVAPTLFDPIGFGLVQVWPGPAETSPESLTRIRCPRKIWSLPLKSFGVRSKWACCSIPNFRGT